MLTMNFIASICATTIVLVSGGPMATFEIDGNYYVDNAGTNIDWITVIDGCRIGNHSVCSANCGAIDGAWKECQSQCVQTGGTNSQYWDSGVFCDTYGNGEQSLLAGTDIFDTFNWVPLDVSSAGPAKGDLTNIFFAGSSIDMIMCLAMERISPNGASYVDFEFIQNEAAREPCLDGGGVEQRYTSYDWKCHYSNRTTNDIQVSFILDSGTSGFEILFCRWRPDFGNAPYETTGFNATQYFADNLNNTAVPSWLPLYDNPFCGKNGGLAPSAYWVFGWIKFVMDASGGVYTASSPTFQEAVDGAVNLGLDYTGPTAEINKAKDYEQASPFGHIYTQKNSLPPSLWMEKGTFMEACIDWQAIGFDDMCYDGLMVKTKASATGSPKDTGGFMPLSICGHTGMTFAPTPPTVGPTKLPSNVPTQPTASSAPTISTPAPTTWQPTSFPTWHPSTEPTWNPTDNPSWQPTNAPTGLTNAPTQPTGMPTPSPTVVAGDPSRAPTKKPTTAPTPHPTVREGDPSRAPTLKPTVSPSDHPSIPPTDAPTITPNCTMDDSWDRDECVEPDGDGCSAEFSTTVAVCILNDKFTRSGIFEYFKDAFINVMEASPAFLDVCTQSAAHVTYYHIGYEDAAARAAAQARPQITRECVDDDTVCLDAYQYTVTMNIGFFCSSCNVMRDIVANFADDEASWRFAFPRDLLGKARDRDHVCSNGFGGVSLENLCVVYKNSEGVESGDTYGDCSVAGPPTSEPTPVSTDADGETDDAVMRQYYFVWILVAVFCFF